MDQIPHSAISRMTGPERAEEKKQNRPWDNKELGARPVVATGRAGELGRAMEQGRDEILTLWNSEEPFDIRKVPRDSRLAYKYWKFRRDAAEWCHLQYIFAAQCPPYDKDQEARETLPPRVKEEGLGDLRGLSRADRLAHLGLRYHHLARAAAGLRRAEEVQGDEVAAEKADGQQVDR